MGTSTDNIPSKIRIIACEQSWIECRAVQQLETVAALNGMKLAVGLPDLHPGKGLPIGAAFVSSELIYPTLIGNDIGCAMSFWQTDIKTRKLKLERWARRLQDLESPWHGDGNCSRDDWCAQYGLRDELCNIAIGTIGGGNHFAELQKAVSVEDELTFAELGLDRDCCALLVHSGSRALGQSIFQRIIDQRSSEPFHENDEQATEYMADHDYAIRWSEANRALIARRFLSQIGGGGRLVSDVPHNMISREEWCGEQVWIHRKGAASARVNALLIPGSRGTCSYLVAPTGIQDANAWSLAHGAGRRWQRGYAKPRLSHKYRVGDLERNPFGGHVICEDRELIYEEAPQAYKDIEQVIDDLKQAGLIRVIAVYQPLLTYKQRRAA